MIDTTTCPECGEPAEVQDRAAMASTDGPVEHVKILCVNRHWFLLPTDRLPSGDAGDTRPTRWRADSVHSTRDRALRSGPAVQHPS